jgi:hypothetical protein
MGITASFFAATGDIKTVEQALRQTFSEQLADLTTVDSESSGLEETYGGKGFGRKCYRAERRFRAIDVIVAISSF